jgi:hypothetical protein
MSEQPSDFRGLPADLKLPGEPRERRQFDFTRCAQAPAKEIVTMGYIAETLSDTVQIWSDCSAINVGSF